MPKPDKEVPVFFNQDGKVDWTPKGLIHLSREQAIVWENKSKSLKLEFPQGHPFEQSPPFQTGAGGATKATVRKNAPLKQEFPCRVTLDNKTQDFTEYGVIIDD